MIETFFNSLVITNGFNDIRHIFEVEKTKYVFKILNPFLNKQLNKRGTNYGTVEITGNNCRDSFIEIEVMMTIENGLNKKRKMSSNVGIVEIRTNTCSYFLSTKECECDNKWIDVIFF